MFKSCGYNASQDADKCGNGNTVVNIDFSEIPMIVNAILKQIVNFIPVVCSTLA
jgi:hypothetical protein